MVNVIFKPEEADVIASALVEAGIDFPFECISTGCFSLDILSQLKKVVLINTRLDDLDFLASLPNLEELVISNLDYQRVADYVNYTDSAFNIIGDYSGIGKITSLKKLVIDNDINVKELDFSRLVNLNHISLTNNPQLSSLKGMGNLHKLDKVLMYGNSIRNFEGFEEYLHNTIDSTINTVDLEVLFTYVKSIEDLVKLYNLYVRGLTHIRFSEKNGQVGHIDMEIPIFVELYKKIYTLFKRVKLFDESISREDKIDYIYRFVTSNVKFAEDELQQRQNLYINEVKPRYGKIPGFFDRHFGALHGSYYAYHFRNANCEGMVNLMKFMSNVLGISGEDVHCSDKKGYSTGLNHAIYRTMYNDVWCYYDPAYRVNTRKDRKKTVGNFAKLSYDDVSSYLNLSRFEKDISYRSYSDKIINLLEEHDEAYDPHKLHNFLEWLYNENILNEPLESLIESNFSEDIGQKLIKNTKEGVK